MDLKPYYKQIASLLRKAAEVVHTEIKEKEKLMPRREGEIKDAQKELKKEEHENELRIMTTEETAMKAAYIKRALDARQAYRDKDKEINDARRDIQSEVDALRPEYDKLLQEARDFDSRT